MKSDEIAQIVRKYLGVPYCHGGRDLTGLDCLGLVHLFYKDCNIQFPDGDGQFYSENWVYEDPERYLRGIKRYGREAPVSDIQPLDLVYFRLGRFISHSGVMIYPGYFIHVLQKSEVCVSPLNKVWIRRLVGVRRFL